MTAPDSKPADPRPSRRRGGWRFAGILAMIALVYALIWVYPVLRIALLLFPGWEPAPWQIFAIVMAPIAMRMLRERWSSVAIRLLSSLTMQLAGLTFALFPIVAIWEGVNLFWPLPPTASGWGLLTIALLIGLGGWYAAAIPRVRHEIVHAPQLAGKTLVHLSDVHLGSRSAGFVRRVCRQVQRLGADRIVITGDLIDASGARPEDLAPLTELGIPIFYVIGNHERYVDLERIDQMLRELGMTVLRNEAVVDGPFQFIGIDDSEHPSQLERQFSQIAVSDKHVPILLYHRPSEFEVAARVGVRLMLSGHTHSGQIFPFSLAVRTAFPRHTGRHELGSSTLYVSQGTGTWGPNLRVGSRSEITLFRFEA